MSVKWKNFKRVFIWFLPFFAFILLMFSLNIVIKDFKYAHTSHMVFKPAYNWIPYYTSQKLKIF